MLCGVNKNPYGSAALLSNSAAVNEYTVGLVENICQKVCPAT